MVTAILAASGSIDGWRSIGLSYAYRALFLAAEYLPHTGLTFIARLADHSSEIPKADSDRASESSEAIIKSTLSNGKNTSGVVRELEQWNFSVSWFVRF